MNDEIKYYILVEVGYEGIDKIVYVTNNKDKIIEKYKEYIKIEIPKDVLEIYSSDSKQDKRDREYWIKDRKERLCIQGFDGKEVKCVCSYCGIKSKRPIYY
jgi:hypothetical protein